MYDCLIKVHTAFGLAFDIEKSTGRKSGFKPSEFDLSCGKPLFGDLRLDGFAAALRTNFAAMLVVVGGDEARYAQGASQSISRAVAIREMLMTDLGVDPDRVHAIPSRANTGGNIFAIAQVMQTRGLTPVDCAIISNHYHLPRIHLDLLSNDLALRLCSAEALWLLENGSDSELAARKNRLVARLGMGALAERMTEEISGIADKLRGTYSRTK